MSQQFETVYEIELPNGQELCVINPDKYPGAKVIGVNLSPVYMKEID